MRIKYGQSHHNIICIEFLWNIQNIRNYLFPQHFFYISSSAASLKKHTQAHTLEVKMYNNSACNMANCYVYLIDVNILDLQSLNWTNRNIVWERIFEPDWSSRVVKVKSIIVFFYLLLLRSIDKIILLHLEIENIYQ